MRGFKLEKSRLVMVAVNFLHLAAQRRPIFDLVTFDRSSFHHAGAAEPMYVWREKLPFFFNFGQQQVVVVVSMLKDNESEEVALSWFTTDIAFETRYKPVLTKRKKKIGTQSSLSCLACQ